MECTCPSKPFKDAFAVAARAVPARTPKPVLQSVLLIADDARAAFIATDIEIGIRHELPGVEPIRPGRVLLPKEQLTRLLAAADGETIRLSLESDRLTIRCGSARWTIVTADAATFPEVPEFTAPAYHTIAASALRRAVKRTVYAVDEKASTYALGGILVEPSPTRLVLVATSGRSLASQTEDATFTGEFPAPTDRQYVIPARAARELAGILPEDDTPVDLGFPSDRTVQVRWNGTLFTSRLTEGKFPPHRRMYPDGITLALDVAAVPFRSAVEQAATLNAGDSRSVTFDFGDTGQLILTASSADVGDARVEFPIAAVDRPMRLALDPSYLSPLLRSLGDDAVIRFEAASPEANYVLSTTDGFRGLVASFTLEKPK